MALRYHGKPDLNANVQANKVPELCFCEFVLVGLPLNGSKCAIHRNIEYRCDLCHCENYRPNKVKTSPNHWPLCVCGHIAQEHN